MAEVRIDADIRTEFGKGGARRTRRAGRIPAVLYGHGTDPRHLSLPSLDFAHAVREQGRNTVLTLNLDGDQLALPKSVVTHPMRDYVEHVDLLVIRRGEKVTVDIQVVVTGDAASGTLVSPTRTRHRGRGDEHPGADRGLHRGPAGRNPVPRRRRRAARGHHAGHRRRASWSSTSWPGADGDAEVEASEGTAEGAGVVEGGPDRRPTRAEPGRRVERWCVGLGNPGPEYAGNRHNVGVDDRRRARRAGRGRPVSRATRPNADVLDGRLAGRRVVLAKPRSYMNLSGGPVAGLLRFFAVEPADQVVVHDDLDLGLRHHAGQVRRRRGRSQRPAVDLHVARHQGLPAGAVRHRPAARPDGPGGLTCCADSRPPSARIWSSPSTSPRMRRRRCCTTPSNPAQNRFHAALRLTARGPAGCTRRAAFGAVERTATPRFATCPGATRERRAAIAGRRAPQLPRRGLRQAAGAEHHDLGRPHTHRRHHRGTSRPWRSPAPPPARRALAATPPRRANDSRCRAPSASRRTATALPARTPSAP